MKVLFVCTGNAHRSPLAEALLKKGRPDLEVDSAGLHVVIPIAHEVKEYLRKKEADQFLKRHPESIDAKRIDAYDMVIAMENRHRNAVLARCPECANNIVVWDIEDPYEREPEVVQNIYERISKKVEELANTL